MQIGSAAPIEIIHTMPGTIEHERKLHTRFASLRMTGEWFSAAPKLLDYINEQRKG
jgi:hypothetical protein